MPPSQSLKLLNSEFIRARAAAFAKQIRPTSDVDQDAALANAFRKAWGRLPTAAELAASRQFLQDQPAEYAGQSDAVARSWVDFCHMLFAASGFLYLK